jgi:alpha-glucosidase (family GH31 glycosyl hydrolase)
VHTRFWWGNSTEGDHAEDLGVDGIKMDLQEMGWTDIDVIGLAHNRGRC